MAISRKLLWKAKLLAKDLPNNKGNDWIYDGNCHGKDTGMFIYPEHTITHSKRHKLTKICEDCPVMLTCRYEAVRNQDEGWWGGMDPKQRMTWAMEELLQDQLND
jgi:hypothetical protein